MEPETSPLANQIVVVTGGGSGINLAFARLAVLQHSAYVLIADLKLTAEAEAFVAAYSTAITPGKGKRVVFVKCDVTKRADLENLVAVSREEWGDVPDVYVAGAGVFEPV
jgi:NAD(P)-dependent dehydrogenase (short-subunit alcohol dehydrogenase family)